MNRKAIYLVLIMALTVFGYFGIEAGTEIYQRWEQENKWEDIRDSFMGDMQSPIIIDEDENNTDILDNEDNVNSDDENNEVSDSENNTDITQNVVITEYEVPVRNIDFNELKRTQNEDIYAWILIPDTNIDYAVLRHSTDDGYYLNHNIDGSKGYPGCIYSERVNSKNFTDKNTILYGHNMKNGTMFKGLHEYNTYEHMKAKPYVFIYTEKYILVYKVFASQVADDKHQIKDYDISSKDKWMKYIAGLIKNSTDTGVYDSTTQIGVDSRILTMSTCTGRDHERWLVHAVLINAIER